jgi:hypothetical protein
MGNKPTLIFAGLVSMVLSVFLVIGSAEAFCVYNKTDKKIGVQERSGHKSSHGFYGDIDPGDNKCCNWQNSDCNEEGKMDSIVRFEVIIYLAPVRIPPYVKEICKDFPIKAGGALTVEGSEGNYKCEARDQE